MLHRDERHLEAKPSTSAEEDLVANPLARSGISVESARQTVADGCQAAGEESEWQWIPDHTDELAGGDGADDLRDDGGEHVDS